jgi:predicted porin
MKSAAHFKKLSIVSIMTVAFGAMTFSGAALADEADVLKKIEALQEEIKLLKEKVEAKAAATSTATANTAAPAGKTAALSAADGITIYGRLDVAVENNKDGDVSRTAIQNFSSRIGFRGERKFNDTFSGIMQIETGLSPDDSANSGALASRNSYVGLKSQSAGTIIAGKYDMPFKSLDGGATVSLLWGNAEVSEIILNGKGTGRTIKDNIYNLHTRQTNVLQYWSPKFNNISVKLAYSPDEVNGAAGTTKATTYGGSVEFDDGTWAIGIATEKQSNKTAVGQDLSGTKATAGYKFGQGTVGLGYSTINNGAGKKTKNWVVTGSYNIGPTILKANYGQSSESAASAKDDLKMFGIELDYPIDKFTTIYTYYTKINNGDKAKARFEGPDSKYSPAAGKSPSAIGLGIRYIF